MAESLFLDALLSLYRSRSPFLALIALIINSICVIYR